MANNALLRLTPNLPGGRGGGVLMDMMGANNPTINDDGVYLKVGPDSLQLPITEYDEEYAESPDTEGGKRVRSRAQRATGKLDLWCHGSTPDVMFSNFQKLEKTVEMCRRNRGILTYVPKDDSVSGSALTRKNLVTNPSFELDLSEWGVGSSAGGVTLTRILTDSVFGSACCQAATDGTNGSDMSSNNPVIPVISGQTYTASAYIKGPAGKNLTLRLSDVTVNVASTNFTCNGTWQRVSVTYTVQSTTARIMILVNGAGQGAFSWFVDGVMLEQASSVGTYFDGDGYVNGTTGIYKLDDDNNRSNWDGTPGASSSTYKRAAITFNVESCRISEAKQENRMIMQGRMECSVELNFQPYGELSQIPSYPLSDVDPFNQDSLTNQEWRLDSGLGNIAISNGQLAPTATGTKILYRPINVIDSTMYLKWTSGASIGFPWYVGFVLKRLNSTNYIFALLCQDGGAHNPDLRFFKLDGGVQTTLVEDTVAALPGGGTAATNYWLKGSFTGNVLALSVYSSDPNGPNPTAPLRSFSYTLAGADATKFGAGVKGSPGIWAAPKDTNERYDDWRMDSSFIESFDPQVNFELLNIPGSVEALLNVNVTDQSAQARKHIEVCSDDRDYDKVNPVPTFLDSDSLIGYALSTAAQPWTRSGAYDPGASGNSVLRSAPLSAAYQQICGTGNQVHNGARKIKTRVWANGTGPVYLRVVYRIGDGAWTKKDWVPIPSPGAWFEVDLGSILIVDPLTIGQTWEARIEAYSATAGDTIDIDHMQILPAKRWGRAKANTDIAINGLLISEPFNQNAALTGASVAGNATQLAIGNGSVGADGGGGSIAWTGPTAGAAPDGNFASGGLAYGGGAVAMNYLKVTGFGFAIPSTSTILGIWFGLYRYAWYAYKYVDSSYGIDQEVYDANVFPTKDGTNAVGVNHASGYPWPINSNVTWYGGDADLWGTTWTYAQINAATFGALIQPVIVNNLSNGDPIDLWWYANQGAAFPGYYGLPWPANRNPEYANFDGVQCWVYYTDSTGTTWLVPATGQSVNDYVIGSGVASRGSSGADANIDAGRYASPGNGLYTEIGIAATVAKPDQGIETGVWRGGVLARWNDGANGQPANVSNFLFACFEVNYSATPNVQNVKLYKRVGAANTLLGSAPVYGSFNGGRRIWLQVDAKGNYFVFVGGTAGSTAQAVLVLSGNDTALATGGALAKGRVGIGDAKTGAIISVRSYDDVAVWAPDWSTPAITQSGQLTISDSSVYRPGGARPTFDGSYMKAAPAGREGRGTQMVVKARRNDVDIQPDDQIADATRVSVDVTPRVALL